MWNWCSPDCLSKRRQGGSPLLNGFETSLRRYYMKSSTSLQQTTAANIDFSAASSTKRRSPIVQRLYVLPFLRITACLPPATCADNIRTEVEQSAARGTCDN
ncbi:hypothetical protein HPB50_016151 [Hyalomma asiaticum]|uniref:Uncharacterized protein n=1 Tax=Hyalomma asiaticum TaxID=266040 RepID=A0ACB7TAW1_HYAAI|nr:hypothetical protein HPB50_016151 [Hyalomma asiaticum]